MARKQIRKKLKEEYESLKGEGGYKAVAGSWGLNHAMVWRIINEDGYWPSDSKIREQLIVQAQRRGVLVKRRGRKRDLFSMDPEELRLRLINRVEV